MQVGDRVKLKSLPEYVKTADPMPMLRSPSVLTLEETGTITSRRPGGYWVVKFTAGSFLLDNQYLEVVEK